jgi:hypothetical protein
MTLVFFLPVCRVSNIEVGRYGFQVTD